MQRAGGSVRRGLFALLPIMLTVTLVACQEDSPTPAGSPASPSVTASPDQALPPASPTVAPRLLPNLRSLEASDIQVEATSEGRRLRFSASLANLGPGPMLVRPSGAVDCPRRQRGTVQVVRADGNGDGEFQPRRDPEALLLPAGCMLDHPAHDHWHFDAMAAYSLRLPQVSAPVVSRDKVSFCLRDNARVPGQPRVVRRSWFGDCVRNGPQGISPGWVDIYEADLDGQWLRLPDSINREVACLGLEADPLDLLAESVESDNAISVAIRVRGDDVRRAGSGAQRACR